MKYRLTLVTLFASVVVGIVAGLGSVSGPQAVVHAATCADTVFTRTCPQTHQSCGVGQCSWVINPLNLNVPSCSPDPDNFTVTVAVTGECDDDVYQYIVALYDGNGYIGGGSLASSGAGGPPSYTRCVGSRIPTAAVLSWTGMPPAGYTKGPSELTITLCCSSCTPPG